VKARGDISIGMEEKEEEEEEEEKEEKEEKEDGSRRKMMKEEHGLVDRGAQTEAAPRTRESKTSIYRGGKGG